MTARTLGLTATALFAFAANSWICRAALRSGAIDAGSFTALRLIAGAVALGGCAWIAARGVRRRQPTADPVIAGAGSWLSALALFAYALLFSLAYLRLSAGVGALLLFGAVQLTMLVGGWSERRPTPREWAAIAVAGAGLVVLTAPTEKGAAHPAAAASMVAAGIAWGIYSLRGRSAGRRQTPPLAENAGNFARSVPLAALLLALVTLEGSVQLQTRGFALALLSGAVTSGLGYAVWYAALPGLPAATAGLVQLAVPILAAFGGVALLGETIGVRLLVASALVLGGIALALASRVSGAPAPPVQPLTANPRATSSARTRSR
jgi:drug/metabolite transporter (DMT)-like permease